MFALNDTRTDTTAEAARKIIIVICWRLGYEPNAGHHARQRPPANRKQTLRVVPTQLFRFALLRTQLADNWRTNSLKFLRRARRGRRAGERRQRLSRSAGPVGEDRAKGAQEKGTSGRALRVASLRAVAPPASLLIRLCQWKVIMRILINRQHPIAALI